MAGRLRAELRQPAGTQVTIRHNEMLREDGRLYLDNLVTCAFTPGADRQVIRYTCRGGEEEYAPRFTYMGFRYAEVTGLTSAPSLEDFTGEVFHTGFRRAGAFACSDPLLTRLQQNIQWSHRSNTMGIPTDCPQRDERCGYTGDMQFFMPTALYNGGLAAFMHKWLTDLCADSQFPDGRFKDHAPDFGMNGGVVGWGEAGVICPYLCYKTYGDTANIQAHLPAMKRFADYLIATANPDHTRGPDCVGLGDWLHMGGGASLEVIGSAYYAYILSLIAEMADAVGDRQAAEQYGGQAAAARAAFSENYLLPDGRVKDSSLTGFALALTMDLVPPDKLEALSAAFAEEVKAQNYRLTTGFLGTPRLLMALGQIGRHDLAERLLMQRECPSWLYPVTVGATTVWERWNGWTKEKGFENPGMNSFNHFAFGSVGEYFFRHILGISQPPEGRGFSAFRIAPVIPDCLTWAAGSYEGIGGRIEVRWEKADGKVRLDVIVPANTTAEIYLPAGAAGSPAAYLEKGEKGFFCGAGKYRFDFSCT
ncbi:MAG: family 78 glycoside hydrolase catalytic domain [Clostridiales bacterium]|nr:family 78 glycoside hydrolase catalytic domain [Clostridiales bacterium]